MRESPEKRKEVGNRVVVKRSQTLRDINIRLKSGLTEKVNLRDFPEKDELINAIKESMPAWAGDRMRQGMLAGAMLAREFFIVKLGIKENDV